MIMEKEMGKPVSALPAEDKTEAAPEATEGSGVPSRQGLCISRSTSTRFAPVGVLHNVLGLFAATESEQEPDQEARERRELSHVIHSMLVVGLAASTIVILIGLSLDAARHRSLPEAVAGYRKVIEGLKRGSPSSFLDLGILLLIATPILRVFGSLIEFVSKRDWRFAVITSLVLLILAVSVMVGST